MKSVQTIIDESLAHVKENGRATDERGEKCLYRTKDKNMCLVGRCFTDEMIQAQDEAIANHVSTVENEVPYKIEGIDFSFKHAVNETTNRVMLETYLKEEYRGHDIGFWCELQRLHDRTDFWDGRELSEKGRVELSRILEYS